MNQEDLEQQTASLGDALLRLVATTETFEDALVETLRLVGETVEWSYGEVWLPDADEDVLRLEATWYDDPALEEFADGTAERTFERGVGLPGRVWRDGDPARILNIAEAPSETFRRVDLAADATLDAAVGIPVAADDDVVGVLVFLTDEVGADDGFVANVHAAARQLGRLLVNERIREKLERERDSFEDVLENSPIPIIVFDADGTISRVNERFETVFELPRGDIVGEPVTTERLRIYDENGDPLDPRAGPSWLALEGGRSVHDVPLEIEVVDGVSRSVVANATPVFGEGDQPTRVITAYVDVTEQRVREAELEAKNAELEAFASIVAHDLRNPLAVANGFTELARETGELEHLERVERAHERMSTLISDLLLLARKGRAIGEKTDVDVARTARMAWESLDTDGATCAVNPDIGTVLADSGRLVQLFENVFRNSVEHGGEDVTIRVEPLDGEPGFYVEDDGPGVPKTRLESLLRGGDDGGLGLKIVSAIAEGHGWTVDVGEAAPGTERPGLRLEFGVSESSDSAAGDAGSGEREEA
jgi:PAS domain S-box-containing protein